MGLPFFLALLVFTGGQPTPQLHVGPRVAAQTPAQVYQAGIAAAEAQRWDVAAERFRQAIARDGREKAGYFPHYWLGVAYDELHETTKALAEWRESQRQGAIARTPEETSMRRRIASHRVTSTRPPPIGITTMPFPPPPQPQPVPQTQTIAVTRTTDTVMPTTTRTETAAMSTGTVATTTEHQHPITPEGELLDEIDRRFKALNPGKLQITAPKTMRVGVTERFILRIASAGQDEGITEDLPASGQTSTSAVHVTPLMRATLSGSGFTIQSNSPEEQLIGGGSYTEWSWQVTPNESGDRVLVVNVHLQLDKRVKAIPKSWPVHVSGNPGLSIRKFLTSNWQWLSSTLVIPLVLFFWRQRKKQA